MSVILNNAYYNLSGDFQADLSSLNLMTLIVNVRLLMNLVRM